MTVTDFTRSVSKDGSVNYEWDSGGNHLLISFSKAGAEVYVQDQLGQEYEAHLSPTRRQLSNPAGCATVTP